MKTPRLASIGLIFLALSVRAAVPDLRGIGVEPHPNALVPRDLSFFDENGHTVTFGDFLDGPPVMLVLGYFRCRKLCSVTLDNLADTLQREGKGQPLTLRVLAVSIDASETAEVASQRKAELLSRHPDAALADWHLLTGHARDIQRLAAVIGFRYALDRDSGQYLHPAGSVLINGSGRIVHYFSAMGVTPSGLREELTRIPGPPAAQTPFEQFQQLCYGYDAVTGTYRNLVIESLRLSTIGTGIAFAAWIVFAHLRTRKRRHRAGPNQAGARACRGSGATQ